MAHAIMFFVFGAPVAGFLVYGWCYCFVMDARSKRRRRARGEAAASGPVPWRQTHVVHPAGEYQCLTCGLRRRARWASCARCNETHSIPV